MTRTRGNILFLILIAVALFAALSYAVTSSSRTGAGSISKDKLGLVASQIIQYATQLEQGYSRVKILNACTLSKISFEPPPFTDSGAYYNSNAPTDKSCHVHHPDGGGVTLRHMDSDLNLSAYWRISISNHVHNVGTDCAANEECGELSYIMIINLTTYNADLLCEELNRIAGITSPAPQDDTNVTNTYFIMC